MRVTPLVCYDLRFPELFAALAPRTDLFVVVANWPVPRVAHFTKLLEARLTEKPSAQSVYRGVLANSLATSAAKATFCR